MSMASGKGGLETAGGAGALAGSVVTALQFVSTQASGSDGFKVTTNGARFHVGTGATDYFSSDGTTVTFAGLVAVSGLVTAGTGLTNTSGRLSANEIYGSATVATFFCSQGGGFWSNALVSLVSQTADGAAAVAVTSNTQSAWSNAAAKLHSFRTNSVEQSFVGVSGQYVCNSFTDDSATTGNRTVNSVRGISAFGAAATAITITNSFCLATTTYVTAVLQTNDATALIKNVVAAAGSFTITLNAAATGTTKVAWQVWQ